MTDRLELPAPAGPRTRGTVVVRGRGTEIVLFLEALRGEPALAPIVTTEASSW